MKLTTLNASEKRASFSNEPRASSHARFIVDLKREKKISEGINLNSFL